MAEELKIDFRNFDRVRNALRYLAAYAPELTDPVMRNWTTAQASALQSRPYAPKLPNQKYKRTGELGRRWEASQVKSGTWAIINRAKQPRGKPYARYVVGDTKGQRQARIHRGRWWVAREVLEGETRTLTSRLTGALFDYWKKHG